VVFAFVALVCIHLSSCLFPSGMTNL
jgi:hypothetical protein